MSFSYGSQETRAAHMRLNKWDVELTSIPYSHGVVLFIATKWKEVSAKQKLKVSRQPVSRERSELGHD